MGAELHLFQDDRRKYLNIPLLGYLNINSVCNKIADLGIIIQSLSLDYLGLSETKLDKYRTREIEIKMVVLLLTFDFEQIFS